MRAAALFPRKEPHGNPSDDPCDDLSLAWLDDSSGDAYGDSRHDREDGSGRDLPRTRRDAFLRRLVGLLPGLAVSALLALLAGWGAQLPWAQKAGASTLTLAIVLGILIGNLVIGPGSARVAAGIDFGKSALLRLGIVLFGLRITFQEITGVGLVGIAASVVMVLATFTLAVQLGTRVFRLDRDTSILIGAGASICGAAAVMATQTVVRARAESVSIAVATVIVFGTLAMFCYPLLYPYTGLSAHAFGIYVGSTVHEVAQVVAASQSVGDQAAASAVIVKMIRVMLLAPFLLALGAGVSVDSGSGAGAVAIGGDGRAAAVPPSRARDGDARIRGPRLVIPWFAVLFIVMAIVRSLHWLPTVWVDAVLRVDQFLLAMAMAALGVCTRFGAIRDAGPGPLKLGAAVFLFLVTCGYLVNAALVRMAG